MLYTVTDTPTDKASWVLIYTLKYIRLIYFYKIGFVSTILTQIHYIDY